MSVKAKKEPEVGEIWKHTRLDVYVLCVEIWTEETKNVKHMVILDHFADDHLPFTHLTNANSIINSNAYKFTGIKLDGKMIGNAAKELMK